MMNFSELWKYFKLLGDPDHLSKEELAFLERFLAEQYQLRERRESNTDASLRNQKSQAPQRLRLDL